MDLLRRELEDAAKSLPPDDGAEDLSVAPVEESLRALDRAEAAISKAKAHVFLRRCRLRNAPEDVISDAESVLKLDANNAEAHLRRGMTLWDLDRKSEARDAVRKASQHVSSTHDESLKALTKDWVVKVSAQQPTSSSSSVWFEWEQDERNVTLIFHVPHIKQKYCDVEFARQSVTVEFAREDYPDYFRSVVLPHEIDHKKCTKAFDGDCVRLTMPKESDFSLWKLEAEYPTDTKLKKKDWASIVASVPDLDSSSDPLNSVFQQIYSNSDEDTRRAMNKSFLESGGKVLSTNWTEVKDKRVEYHGSSDSNS